MLFHYFGKCGFCSALKMHVCGHVCGFLWWGLQQVAIIIYELYTFGRKMQRLTPSGGVTGWLSD